MWVLIIAGSIFISDVSTIFEFVGLVCINCLSFIFPATFYIFANRYFYRNLKLTDSYIEPNYCLIGSAWLQLIMGVIAFLLGLINNIKSLVK